MHFCKILILSAVGLLFTNARVIKQRRQRRIRQRPTSCGCPLPLIDTPCLDPCCQSLYLEELPNRPICGCQYKDVSCAYNKLEPPNYSNMPVMKLPKMSASLLPAGCCYDTELLPAINLPEIASLPGLAKPGFVTDLLCPRQVPVACQCVDIPYGCRTQMPIVEYMSSVPRPILPAPISESCIQGPKCQSIKIPYCESQNMPCNCQNMCGGRSMPCGYKNTPCDCLNLPCGCQNILCGNLPCDCQNMPCSCQNLLCGNLPCDCQNMPCSCQTLPCSCQNMPCGCTQNVIQYYGPQLPALELPCACQACQLAPIELPAYSCGCQMLPPPVIGCCGKYLRQVTLQPPFL